MAEEKRVAECLYCSFCGKERREVCKLIAGPTVFICNECVWLCVAMIEENTMQDKQIEHDPLQPTNF